jgi:K+-transporting ATPase A subunit
VDLQLRKWSTTAQGWLQIALCFLLILACAKPLGTYIAAVMEGRPNLLPKPIRPFERLIYRLCGVDEFTEQSWLTYAASLLAFSVVSGLLLYAKLVNGNGKIELTPASAVRQHGEPEPEADPATLGHGFREVS